MLYSHMVNVVPHFVIYIHTLLTLEFHIIIISANVYEHDNRFTQIYAYFSMFSMLVSIKLQIKLATYFKALPT